MHFMKMTSTSLRREPRNSKCIVSEQAWAAVRPDFERLYIQKGKPLNEVMAILKSEFGFSATTKQYKTRIERYGLHKYHKLNRAEATSDASLSAPGPMHRARNAGQHGRGYHMNTISAGDGELMNAMTTDVVWPSPVLAFNQGPMNWRENSNTTWSTAAPIPLISYDSAPLIGSVSRLRNNTQPLTSFKQLMEYCGAGLERRMLQLQDLFNMEPVAEFLTIVGLHEDAFMLWDQILCWHAAAPSNSASALMISRAASMVFRSAIALHNPASIFPLISRTMHWSHANMSNSGHSWTLLRSTVGSIFSLMDQFPAQALTLCRASVIEIHDRNVTRTFDWRFAVLVMNLKQIHMKKGEEYDHVSAWRDYLACLAPATIPRIDSVLERLFMWSITALEDVNTWESFDAFEELSLPNSSELNGANIREFEIRTIFCYFWSCFQNKHLLKSKQTSGVHEELESCLEDLEGSCCTSRAEALSTIATMLVHSRNDSDSEPYSFTGLRQRVLCQVHRIHFARAPLGIFAEAGWKGSRFSAIFLETLVSKQCSPSHYTKSSYRNLSDPLVRDFIESHFTVEVLLQNFVYNPAPDSHLVQEAGTHQPGSLAGILLRGSL